MRMLAPVLAVLLFAVPAAEAAKKKPKPGKGPSAQVVRTHVGPVIDAQHTEGWMTEEQVTVEFRKIVIGGPKRIKSGTGYYDPYMWAWPVKADIVVTVCRDTTGAEPCEVKRAGYWTKNILGGRDVIWFDRFFGSGGWHWATSSE